MPKVLVCYASTEGQTKKLALALRHELVDDADFTLLEADEAFALPLGNYDAFVLAASVHHWQHQSSMVNFVRDNLDLLTEKPSCFLSLSLSAALPDQEHQAEARSYMERFFEQTNWQPNVSLCVAGALRYKEMDYLRQTLAKLILERTLGTTDVDFSKDYDFTDYEEVYDFVRGFLKEDIPN